VGHGRADPVTEPVSKTQMIRLADVFFIGPVMVYGGSKLRERGDTGLGVTLMLLGVATILYNGKNYLKQREVGE
jgi:hypothetical protein